MPLDNLRNCHVVSSCLALSAIFLLLPLSASAQDSARGDATTAEVQASATLETERCGVDEDCDDSDARATPGSAGDLDGDGFDDAVEQANYNNSRSNRANIVAPDGDTNVCDGVTCPDGSCAATPAECPVERNAEMLPPAEDLDSDDDGLDDGSERAQNHNSSRSNETEDVAPDDADSDGDGLSDGAQPKIVENERVQNHNSSRSNRHNLRSVFSDTDADGRPEVTLRNGAFMPVDQVSQGSADAAGDGVVCWGRAEDEEGKVYSWGRGICIAGTATANATTTAQARLAALQVRGDEVRGWTEEQQAAWREFRETRATTTAEERLVEQMVETTRANSRVQEIRSDEDGVGMQYRAEMRLFGLIPLERNLSAEVTTAGEVEVDYPWYRFLSRVPEQSTIRNILTDLQVVHGSGGGAGRVSI